MTTATVKTKGKRKGKFSKKNNMIVLIDKEINKVLSKKGLKPELKLFDNGITITNLPKSDGPAYVTNLNNVVGGSGESQRTGNKITMIRLKFKMCIAPKSIPGIGQNFGAGDNGGCMVMVRAIIVLDTQQVGDTSPALSDVLASALNNDQPIISPQTILQQKRFKILWSKVVMCETTKNYHVIGKTIKLQKDAIYNGSAATDIQRNGLYLMTWYNDFGVPVSSLDQNQGPRFLYYSRLEYTDC